MEWVRDLFALPDQLLPVTERQQGAVLRIRKNLNISLTSGTYLAFLREKKKKGIQQQLILSGGLFYEENFNFHSLLGNAVWLRRMRKHVQ